MVELNLAWFDPADSYAKTIPTGRSVKTMRWTAPGYSHTPEYQSSLLPFAVTAVATTGSANRIEFPMVTKFITVRASGSHLDVGFTENGLMSSSNYFRVAADTYETFELRVKEMFVKGTGTYYVLAGLTNIPTASIPYLTGSWPFDASDPYSTGSNAFSNRIVYTGVG